MMNSKLLTILVLGCIPSLLLPTIAATSSKVEIIMKVIDEKMEPIPDAQVYISYEQGYNPLKESSNETIFEGSTKKDGTYKASSRTKTGYIYLIVTRPGYYESRDKFTLRRSNDNPNDWERSKIDYVMKLKKIENPVPMYAKRILWKRVPIGTSAGFDMEIGDFVQPFGEGKVNDLIFNFTGTMKAINDREENLMVSFTSKGDGIQEFLVLPDDHSEFKSPKLAPAEGYTERLEFSILTHTGDAIEKKGTREDQNFVFRVRTILDEQGNVIQANYGKIYGPIEFGFSMKAGMISFKFDYYFNPDGTRNLEFDPKRNLFSLDGRNVFEAPSDAP